MSITSEQSNTKRDVPAWDGFKNTPDLTGETVSMEPASTVLGLKIIKLITIIITLLLVLGLAVVSKGTLLFMTSQVKKNTTRSYCNAALDVRQQYIVTLPDVERVAWIWILIISFSVPELGTLVRSVRIFLFKSYENKPTIWMFLELFFTETAATIGSAILVFVVLPELDVVKGAMLTNAVCFIPGVLAFFSRNIIEKPEERTLIEQQHIPSVTRDNKFKMILDMLCVIAQASSFVVWPLIEGKPILYLIPVSVILISIGWWENYVSEESPIPFIRSIAKTKKKFTNERYYLYMYISVWKIVLFIVSTMLIIFLMEGEVWFLFTKLGSAFSERSIWIQEIEPVVGTSDAINYNDAIANGNGSSDVARALTPFWVFLINILATYLCYAVSKFTCKILIQGVSLAIPINLSVPVLVTGLIAMVGLYNQDNCVYDGVIPKYLFFNMPPLSLLQDFISKQHSWIWLIWLLSQAWITIHIWDPSKVKLASTEKLFMKPMYDAFLIDQSIAMNRRRHTEKHETVVKKTQDEENSITRIFPCGTMWHETEEEMRSFLYSIFRLDLDAGAYKIARFVDGYNSPDYYELETNIFVDDAFDKKVDEVTKKKTNIPVLNEYVRNLIKGIKQHAKQIYGEGIEIQPPVVWVTPYGGRLEWTLPGETKLIAHLKNKEKIRNKKRWSQVMYMYYLLGFRLMENKNIRDEYKDLRAENTYILALDGDIDFQPKAMHLLVDYMKKNPKLGAACGRIHPVGSGAIAWYQVFEYAIGHWLQKATEHVIGCVLCSPGCFSLFRASALMDDRVMCKYTTEPSEPRHHVQYDQGEDRWLCTLLLQRGYRVEYSAASDSYTHCPTGFGEFYNQRRRWMPSTTANIIDLLGSSKETVKNNDNISTLYIFYQIVLLIGSVLGPGSIFIMLIGAFVAAFKLDQWNSLIWNLVPILIFILVCAICESNTQIMVAGLLSAIYGLIMMAVLVGVMLQIKDDGLLAPSSLFFFCMAGEFIITALLHPNEFYCLKYGVIYYVTVPSMYMLLVIYSVFNMNNVSWGTREKPAAPVEDPSKPPVQVVENDSSYVTKVMGLFKRNSKKTDLIIAHINASTKLLEDRLNKLEEKMKGGKLEKPEEPTNNNIVKTTILEGEDGKKTEGTPSQAIYVSPEEIDMDWVVDTKFEFNHISNEERKFWNSLIEKYLKPLNPSKKEKEDIYNGLKDLRDMMVYTFFMLNSLFVLIVFLLTLEKDTLHVNWPVDPKVNFTYDDTHNEIIIQKEYLQLEPIGFVFLIFFAVLLVVQFSAMLVHRFGTYCQLMASTTIDFFGKDKSYKRNNSEGNVIDLIKNAAQARPDEKDKGEEKVGRRKTAHNILQSKNKPKRRFTTMREIVTDNLQKMNVNSIPESHRSKFVELRRKSLAPDSLIRNQIQLRNDSDTDSQDTETGV